MQIKNNIDIRAAIFDLDGLMLDTEIVSYRGWQQACRDLGYNLDDDTYHKIIGLIVADMKPIFDKAFGSDFPLQQADRKRLRFMYDYFEKFGVLFKPGLHLMLDMLDKRHIPKAVATSSCRESAMIKITAGKLLERFEVIVTGDDVRRGKPAPDIFLTAAVKLKVSPANCLVFEDSENGSRAAYNAKMPVIIIPDVKEPADEIAHLAAGVFPSLKEAVDFVEKHLGKQS